MRIAYVCSDRGIPVGGNKGASIHVRSVVRALVGRGHQLTLFASRAATPPEDLPADVVDIGFDRLLKQLRLGVETAGNDSLLARETYSLVLNTHLRQELEQVDARARIDAVYERYSLWSWAGLHFARDRGIPFVLEVNAPLVQEQQSYRDLSLRPVATAIEGLLLREADAVIVPSGELRPHVRAAAGKRRKVHVIPNGADLDLFADPPRRPPADLVRQLQDRFVVAFLGTLKPWHGIDQLLQAFRRLHRTRPESRLLVIGDGPMQELVDEARSELGPEVVIQTGSVAHDEVAGWLALADVGVAPYPALKEFYFCPLKIIEYLAAGLPVVASEIGDAARLVRHEKTGLLVPPGRSRELARALVSLERDAKGREKMGRRALAQARRQHGWDRAAASIERILTACADKIGAPVTPLTLARRRR